MPEREWNPGNLLALSGSYWQTCALHAAVKLDLFTVISNNGVEPAVAASRIDADERGITMLLNALAAMELLTKSGDRFTNTTAAETFLSKGSKQYIGHMIMHHHHLMDSWSRLHEGVLTGEPLRPRSALSREAFLESFLMGMFTLAMNLAPKIVEAVDLSGCRHLLDLGGGPGTYAVHFCLNNPELKASVFDLPASRPYADETIQKFGLADRIDFLEGDYLEDPIPGSYDAAWLSHILHGEGPDGCRLFLDKAASALKPGGLIIVHEFILKDTMDGPLFPALFSLNMLLGTKEGQSYSEKQITGMLTEAGVGEIRRIPFESPNDSGLIIGTV
ncbi:methyltransferase [Thermodesulfobacteriota bacterium]